MSLYILFEELLRTAEKWQKQKTAVGKKLYKNKLSSISWQISKEMQKQRG